MSLYMQFGARMCGPSDWLNFDVSPTLRLQRLPLIGTLFERVGPRFPRSVRYGDIVRGLPITERSCCAIYCSHVLEHLALDDFRAALANTFRYLAPSGHFRFVLPDLERLAESYLASNDASAAVDFMKDSRLGWHVRPRGISGLLRTWLGNSAHLWMWDFKSISAELSRVGFAEIRRAEYGDSGDVMFEAVEDIGRWDSALGVDCIKPHG